MRPPTFLTDGETILSEAREAIDTHRRTIACLDYKNASFESTIIPLALAENDLLHKKQFLEFHRWISEDVADAATKASGMLTEYEVELGQRQDVFEAVKASSGTGEDAMLLEKMMNDFQKNGLHLPDSAKTRLASIKVELDSLHSEYMKNLQGKAQIAEDYKSLKKGVMEPPAYMNIMKSNADEELRQKAYQAWSSRAVGNTEVLQKIIDLRSELAKLLGYQNFAQYKTSDAGIDIGDFMNEMSTKLNAGWKPYERRFKQLKKQDIEKGLAKTEEIQDWDRLYYTTLMMEKDYAVETLAFPVDATIQTVLSIYEKIFGLKFKQLNVPAWHDDVQVFEVYDEDFLGWLYMDLYSREGKVPNFSDQPVHPGFLNAAGVRQPAATALMCSFEREPLSHDDCIMLFHELGHGIHDMVGKTKYARFHGASTGNFNETPSQMLEHWCWDEEVLKILLPGTESISDKLSPSLEASKASRLLKCLQTLRVALFDMKIHSGAGEINDVWFTTIPHYGSDGVSLYIYLLCEVYAADMFTMFKGPFDSETGLRYKSSVIGKGGSVKPIEMLREFLGRDPSPEAFFKELGIE